MIEGPRRSYQAPTVEKKPPRRKVQAAREKKFESRSPHCSAGPPINSRSIGATFESPVARASAMMNLRAHCNSRVADSEIDWVKNDKKKGKKKKQQREEPTPAAPRLLAWATYGKSMRMRLLCRTVLDNKKTEGAREEDGSGVRGELGAQTKRDKGDT